MLHSSVSERNRGGANSNERGCGALFLDKYKYGERSVQSRVVQIKSAADIMEDPSLKAEPKVRKSVHHKRPFRTQTTKDYSIPKLSIAKTRFTCQYLKDFFPADR